MRLIKPSLSSLLASSLSLLSVLAYDYDSWSRTNAVRIDSTRTILAGPLTTVFTPAASCFATQTTAIFGAVAVFQGFSGPNGDDCAPENWKDNRYFSPGQCPFGYMACTLPTETQRVVTTEICCPSGFECIGQDYCSKYFSTPSVITYTDSTMSTKKTIYGVKATPIQIRFEASDSTAVPIPTESFDLPKAAEPKHELSKQEKGAIVLGVVAGIVLVALGGYFGWRSWKNRKGSSTSRKDLSVEASDDAPPPYSLGSYVKDPEPEGRRT